MQASRMEQIRAAGPRGCIIQINEVRIEMGEVGMIEVDVLPKVLSGDPRVIDFLASFKPNQPSFPKTYPFEIFQLHGRSWSVQISILRRRLSKRKFWRDDKTVITYLIDVLVCSLVPYFHMHFLQIHWEVHVGNSALGQYPVTFVLIGMKIDTK